MYGKIIVDLVDEVRDISDYRNFLLRDLFYVANKFTISSAFRTLIPSKTAGLYAFVEETNFERAKLDFIIRYIGRADDIRNRLIQHEKKINNVLDKIRNGIEEDTKYFHFARKILDNPESYAIYIWRWKEPRPIHKYIFNGMEIELVDAEGITGGILGEVFGEYCYNREFISTSVWAMEKPNENFINRYKKADTRSLDEEKKTLMDKWSSWCMKNITVREISLFFYDKKTNQLFTKKTANGDMRILRHPDMEEMIEKEVARIYDSYQKSHIDFEYDGLIYLVYTYWKFIKDRVDYVFNEIPDNEIIPIYIGKTETIGVNGGYSVNIKGVHNGSNKGKFARWGDASAYHIGDLSNVLFKNRETVNFKKYKKWAEFFFEPRVIQSNNSVFIKLPFYFWIKAWHKNDLGIIQNMPCSTTFLERQLITLSKILFSQVLLNKN